MLAIEQKYRKDWICLSRQYTSTAYKIFQNRKLKREIILLAKRREGNQEIRETLNALTSTSAGTPHD
jgi:hypothetical protein